MALATAHHKERAIATPFRLIAGLDVVVPPGLDTDALGTFTGERPRLKPARETALQKARLGMAASGLPRGLASEGSFGPHPAIPFLATAHELLCYVDETLGLTLFEEHVSAATNFAALDLDADADLEGFLSRAGFPSHALVLRGDGVILKGIQARRELDDAVRRLAHLGPLRLETDMRAHMNPTRMAEIGVVAEKLALRLATRCPACGSQGFGHARSEQGLPCADCGTPTAMVRSLIHACPSCGHEEHHARPDKRTSANPAQCPFCNP